MSYGFIWGARIPFVLAVFTANNNPFFFSCDDIKNHSLGLDPKNSVGLVIWWHGDMVIWWPAHQCSNHPSGLNWVAALEGWSRCLFYLDGSTWMTVGRYSQNIHSPVSSCILTIFTIHYAHCILRCFHPTFYTYTFMLKMVDVINHLIYVYASVPLTLKPKLWYHCTPLFVDDIIFHWTIFHDYSAKLYPLYAMNISIIILYYCTIIYPLE